MRDPSIRVLGGTAVMLWGIAAIPGVAADQVCYTTVDGLVRCTKRLSYGARIALFICASILISVVLSLILCLIMRNRKSRIQETAVYHVDATQIQGPPTTYVTSFDPRSAAAYPQTPVPASPVPGSAKSAQFPVTHQRYVGKFSVKPPRTAPVNQAYSGGYPFPGYSPRVASAQQPYTSFTGGFPKPLYTGQPVEKDDLREVHKDTV